MISLTCRRQWFGQPPYNKNEPWTRGNAAIQSDNETVAAAHAPGRPTSPRISCAPARIRGNSAFALAARRSPSGQEGGILCIICDPYGGKQHAPKGAATAKPIRDVRISDGSTVSNWGPSTFRRRRSTGTIDPTTSAMPNDEDVEPDRIDLWRQLECRMWDRSPTLGFS